MSVGISILMILAGVLAIVVPPVAGIAVALLVGWLLILSGVAHFLFGWNRRHSGGMAWEILLGILYVVAGGYILGNPVAGLASLTLFLAIYLFIEAVLELALYAGLRQMHRSGWILLDGLVTLILAIMIWRSWPSSSVFVIGTLVGISMLLSGISRLALSGAVRSAAAG